MRNYIDICRFGWICCFENILNPGLHLINGTEWVINCGRGKWHLLRTTFWDQSLRRNYHSFKAFIFSFRSGAIWFYGLNILNMKTW